MSKHKKPLPLLPNVEITGIAAEGKAIARTADGVIFVPFVVPNDIVDLQVTKKKSKYMEAVAVRFEKYAENRCKPFCRHFGICGGCKWQILPYAEQLRFKQQQVVDNLTRIGKIELPEIQPILGSRKTEYYRNKLEFTFSNKRWRTYEEIKQGKEFDTMNALGFHIPGLFDKVLDIEECCLMDNIQNRIRNEIRRYALREGLTFFDLREHTGFLRTIMLRTATTGEVMLVVVFFYEDKMQQNALLQHIANTFPEITSLLYIINPKANDTFTDLPVTVFKGRE
ncbi:MAG: TRAM domain-containing protein, partial [Paludibacter sp.]|nr:TRAM domain-containing protein [Paludibacter sp.]